MLSVKRLFDTNYYCKESEKQGEIPPFFKIAKEVMKIIFPSMVETFLISLVTIFDGIQIAGVNNNAVSAVGVCKQPYFILVALISALNVALSAIVARRKGQKDISGANKAMHLGFCFSFLSAITLSSIMFIIAPYICRMMKAEEGQILDYAITYLRIMSSGFVFNALAMSLNACQKSVGNTKISMISNMVANGVNVFLNFCLINGNLGFPKLEVAGAALASIIGQFVAFLIALSSTLLGKDYVKFSFCKLFKWGKDDLAPLLKLLPSVLIEQLLMRIGFITFAIIVNNLGGDDIFIQTGCNDINSLLFTIADGFSIGTSAVVGHKLGARRLDLAVVYAKVCMVLSVFSGLIICLIMVILRNQIFSLYKPDSEYKIKTASNVLLIAASTCVFQNLQWVNTGILRSAGDSKFTATTALISIVAIRPIFSVIMIYFAFNHVNSAGECVRGLGVYGAWIAQMFDQFLRMCFNLTRFHSRKWTKIKV